MEKQRLLTATFVSLLLIMAVAEACFKLAQANPSMYYEHVDPRADATLLAVSVSSPKNHATYSVNNVDVTFSVNTEGTSISSIYGIYFETNWLKGNVTVYKQNPRSPEFPKFWSYDETFWDLPDGDYSVVITAWGGGGYAKGMTAYNFDMTTISVANFTIATPPEVSILSPLNRTYDSFVVSLNFTVNKPVIWVGYSLDGRDDITVAGNTTLSGLSNGLHNVTVYANDTYGNMGASEPVTFTVAKSEPSPTALVATASGVSAAVACLGLLVCFKKRKH